MSATALLKRESKPTAEEVRKALWNLCRCTGYINNKSHYGCIGTRYTKLRRMINGSIEYPKENTLYAKKKYTQIGLVNLE